VEYRQLGNTGLRVSEIGLGCGPLGADPAADYEPLLHRALDLGVNFFDSADFYSDYRSEEWLGRAFSARRADVIIATKFGTIPGKGKDFSLPHMRRSLHDSLRRLRTDYLDLYQLHSPPESILDDHDLLAALRDLKDEGLIRSYGISLDGAQFALNAMDKWRPDALQILFNLFNMEPAGCFDQADQQGVGLIIKAPLDSGMLGGDLSQQAPLKDDDPRPRWGEEGTAQRQRLLDALRFLTQGGRTYAQAALQFVLSFDAVSTVIPGTTSIAHLEEDVAAAGTRLTRDEMARLESLLDGEFPQLNLGW
jgi:aryl-alcohol dehydrogenase-like predicted oxidoreductase